jgi:hypothetical protein
VDELSCVTLVGEDIVWGYPLNIVARHNASTAHLEIGTSMAQRLHEQLNKENISEEELNCWQSLRIVGLDDLSIFVK